MSEEKKPDVKEEVKTPTLEDLQKQIEALTAENNSLKADAEKAKKTISNANEDAASWKKQYRATLDEATRKEAERAEAEQMMRDELNALKAEKRISVYTQRLMEVGYDPQTAATMAVSLPEGISDDFFATQKSFLDQQKQIAKTEALNNQPGLSAGTPPTAPSNKEDLKLREWMGLPTK